MSGLAPYQSSCRADQGANLAMARTSHSRPSGRLDIVTAKLYGWVKQCGRSLRGNQATVASAWVQEGLGTRRNSPGQHCHTGCGHLTGCPSRSLAVLVLRAGRHEFAGAAAVRDANSALALGGFIAAIARRSRPTCPKARLPLALHVRLFARAERAGVVNGEIGGGRGESVGLAVGRGTSVHRRHGRP